MQTYLKISGIDSTVSERTIKYWLKGNPGYAIPEDIINAFLQLDHFRNQLVNLQSSSTTIEHIFKIDQNMWQEYPELNGLPVGFLNQLVIKLDIKNLSYFEDKDNLP